MTPLTAYFKSCHLYHRSYLLWQTNNTNIKEYHMARAKVDMELARAFMNIERKQQNRRAYP